ncbi:hypothetical protein HOLleu_37924 [Holothuria leucospilota]|uniref:Uncharacterized protein n=1 Tax=Holothuria leucospilota TaxID=206669 RepID=A0A9Q0YIQ3_HOLLE|nr:hypothetical protein HOLleu_37924 [Holothuria leucospilota]
MAVAGRLVMPFEPSPRSKSRYQNLSVLGDRPMEDEEGQEAKEYAAFLREQERKCGPDGFLDSSKYTHSFQVRGKVLESKSNKPKRNEGFSGRRVPTPPKHAKPANMSNKQKDEKPSTVVDLVNNVKKDEQDFEKKLKLIEDHMWLHRQEERDLKRSEGDILKSQQILKRTMRDYEIAINRKKMAEEKKILDNKQKEFFISNQYVHQKENMTKEEIEKSISTAQQEKGEDRKVFLSIGDLERKYRAKMSEIELRRAEVQKLSEQFEKSMQLKEEETSALNKELTELALTISMEVKKKREQDHNVTKQKIEESESKRKQENEISQSLDSKLKRNELKANQYESNKRQLSADVNRSKLQLSEKLREEGRHLLDTKNRLMDNSVTQKKLQEAALNAKLDWTNKQIEHRLQAHDARKQKNLQAISQAKRTEHEESVAKWHERFSKKQYESQRRENEDNMKHATRAVNKLEEIEYNLSNRVRDAELTRKQREQQCKRLMNKLGEMRRRHAAKLKKEMVEMNQLEKDLEQKILREQSYLFKSHVNREEGYLTLQQHRIKMQEDKNLLSEVSREHQRLLRIGEKTDMINSFS